jgi:integrase
VAAGVEPKRENGCHALRHFYASTLLDAGESILALSEYLGHADPGFTLRTYTHLMPSSTERTKTAIDAMLAGDAVESAPEDDTDGSEP